MQRILSGIQPTNRLTLGNYLGAIKQFIELQDQYEMFIFIADLHAISVPYDAKQLYQNKLNLVASYYALGLSLTNNVVFYQSDLLEHTALCWTLICHTSIGELNRMTQFKDKSTKLSLSNKTETVPAGLLLYPVLMASDILLYDADYVPVGIDQKQHVELTRDIAIRMNNKYGQLFKVCEPLFPKQGAKIMDLLNPTIKMSKSNTNENGTIFLDDDPSLVSKKILGAKTDSINKVQFDIINQPGISNLLVIYSCLANESIDKLTKKYDGKNYGEFKKDLIVNLTSFLTSFQTNYRKAMKEINLINEQLKVNSQKCKKIVNKKLELIYKVTGLIK